ncbi:MAG: hypothetical protein Q7R76_05900 [Candidatus Woesearchaeota archaeon]|nr:hypothetical protein [Candidatus Woesearchaeota archaeon]
MDLNKILIVAKNPASILCLIGALGVLAGMQGAWVILGLGVFIHLIWLKNH